MSPAFLLEGGITEAAVRALTLQEWLDRWHEFYLMAGTAAVTLAGLLFVALSLHIDRLVEESHEHLRVLARLTFLSFTVVLFASMFMLVPVTGAHQLAIMLGVMSVSALSWMVRMTRTARHHDEAGFSRGRVRKRLMFPTVGYVLMLLTAVGLWLRIPEILYMMIGAVCMILGNAAGTSWELLVEIARHRRAVPRG